MRRRAFVRIFRGMAAKPPHPWRVPLLIGGWLLIAASPVVGVLPGPGGIFVFAAGVILLLRNSAWARRRYVAFKRRWPKVGHHCDRAMRRPSARRRNTLAEAPAATRD